MITFDESALVLMVPEAEKLVGSYRRKFTTDGAIGMPAHITILYPFLKSTAWNDTTRRILMDTVARLSSFSFQLVRLNRFREHNILYLELSPDSEILNMIHLVSGAFPDHPPFGGEIPPDKIIPHLTVAAGFGNDEIPKVEQLIYKEVASHLPLNISVGELSLAIKVSNRWTISESFKLGDEG
nr:2'-5' RNA ligase family protein [candidate division Zixibacteria bacterium]